MRPQIKSPEDFWAGLMFIAFGLTAIVVAQTYPMGSAVRMGPGYFPTGVGAVLMALGAAITVRSLKISGRKVERFAWRSIVMLSVAFATFAWAIDRIGFIAALFIVIVLSSLAGRETRFKEIVPLSIVLVLACWALFIYGLELPFPLWW